MSQIDVATKSRTRQRASGIRAAFEDFVRNFEWTWTSAVLFSLALTFFILISTSIMPSFWMYYAEQKLNWAGPTDLEAALRQVPTLLPGGQQAVFDQLLLMIRDGVAMGLTTLPFVLVLVVSAALQNWRRKLRGSEGGARPTGGYR